MNLKKLLKAGTKYITSPDYRFLIHAGFGWHNAMPDEAFLKRKFKAIMGREPDLENPKTFNEKLQWLKLHDRRPEYTMMADKYAVRAYIAEKLGEEYLIPLLGVWDDPEAIDFDALPERFVLKCNHNSGLGMCICKDKTKLDTGKVKQDLKMGLQQDYYLTGREWPYKNINRRIIAERYLSDGTGDLPDYKIHCFNGQPKFILVCRDRFNSTGLTEDFYTESWEHLPVKRPNIPNAKAPIPRPEQLEEMLRLASVLAKDIPFARIDFYAVSGKLYFGEITFFPATGMAAFEPDCWDERFGTWLTLPQGENM